MAVLGVSLLVVASQFGVAAASTINELCDDGRMDVDIDWDEGVADWRVTALDFTELGAGCDGVVVAVEILGNDAGDTSAPSDVLATLYSDEEPCTGEEIDPAVGSVQGGALTLELCSTAPSVRPFEVTGFTFYSLGPDEVLGEQQERTDDTNGAVTRGGGTTDEAQVLGEQLSQDRVLPRAGSSPLAGGLMGVGAVLIGVGMLRIVRPARREVRA